MSSSDIVDKAVESVITVIKGGTALLAEYVYPDETYNDIAKFINTFIVK